MGLLRRISTVSSYTLLSRVFGFVRDVVMAGTLGASMIADAFFIAFKLPNFFRRLFGEGAFAVAFVPMFAQLLGKDITPTSKQAAEAFAAHVLAWLLPTLVLLLIIMEVGMVSVMWGLTGGFDGDKQKFDLVVELGRYTFPYLLLISLVTYLAGILNAFERYAAAAFAPVILNICMIMAMVIFRDSDLTAGRAVAISVSVSGGLQLLLLYIACVRAGINLRLTIPKPSKDVRNLMRLIGPAAFGAGVLQLNLLIDVLLAARFLPEGSVSWLFYGDRLNQLPIGVIGVAIGTVLLPSISRLLAGGDTQGAITQQNKAMQIALMLTVPAATALILVPDLLIQSLFERGAFTAAHTHATAAALMAYACGLPAYILIKVLAPGYFARKDTKTPVKIAVISLLVNTVLNLILIHYFAHVGLALATSVAAWLNALMLYVGLKRRAYFYLQTDTLRRCVKILLSSIIMGGVVWSYQSHMGVYFAEDTLVRVFALVGLVCVGVLSYTVAAIALKAVTLKELRRLKF